MEVSSQVDSPAAGGPGVVPGALRVRVLRPKGVESERPAELPASSPDSAPRRYVRARQRLVLADLISAGLAVAAVSLLGAGSDVASAPLTGAVLAASLLIISASIGLYAHDSALLGETTLDEFPSLVHAATGAVLVVWLLAEASGWLDHPPVLLFWAALVASVVTGRAVVRWKMRSRDEPERCLVIGDEQTAALIADKLRASRTFGSKLLNAEMVGRVALHHGHLAQNGGPPMLGPVELLEDVIANQRVERVVIAPEVSDRKETLDAIRKVRSLGVNVSLMPRSAELLGDRLVCDDVEGLRMLGLPSSRITGISRAVKRAFDVIVSSLALIVLSPLLIAIAVGIKLGSPGPVFFRQLRRGGARSSFELLKFRTMHDGADAEKPSLESLNEGADGFFKISSDPRITKLGFFLRRHYLDELPQLFNVLRGEMSMVGPRPLIPEETTRLTGWRGERWRLRPGITGIWQMLGSSQIPFDEMARLDYQYVSSWSLWLDVKIIIRTVFRVFRGRGV
jgi:exopolysaccharide biosynthesis polyprenyl glycosylphosphotransferase